MARRQRAGRGGARRVRRFVVLVAAGILLAPAIPIALLRVVPPLTTPFMLARRAPFAAPDIACAEIDYDWVPAERIARAAFVAVIAAEDQRFAVHRGFDLDAIGDALEERRTRGRVRGASTISQQVAKNLFLWPGRSWVRKGAEAWLTIGIELLWPKQRILEVYVNVAQLGPCTFGVEAASRRHFGKSAARLTADEAALLAAVLPDPVGRRLDAPSAQVQARARWIARQARNLEASRWVPALKSSH
jgi:monofunctional glycosyltransferase